MGQELGKFQRQFVADLRAYPERQATCSLGSNNKGICKYCFLGQALVTFNEMFNLPEPFIRGRIFSGKSNHMLESHWETLGFYGPYAPIINIGIANTFGPFTSLSEANDNRMPWPEIADFIEADPANVFSKPV